MSHTRFLPRSVTRGVTRVRGKSWGRGPRLAGATWSAVPCAAALVEVVEPRRLLSAGYPDATYGQAGTGSSPFPGIEIWVTAGLDNRNGKTVVAGEAAEEYEVPHASWTDTRLGLVRFTESGEPDPTFGGDGRILSDLLGDSPGSDFNPPVTDVLIQPDDRILVTGALKSDGSAALVRFNADGSLDTSFGGGDGVVTFEF